MYGLKQASKEWNCALTSHLVAYRFVQYFNDHCLFTMKSKDTFHALLVYVDDLLIIGPDMMQIEAVKDPLHETFTIKNPGLVKNIN